MSLFLGIDVAKTKIDLALVNESNQVLWQDTLELNNQIVIAEYLMSVKENYPDETITAIVESTGRYHYPSLDGASCINSPIRVVNPILTRQMIKSSIRGSKTDKTDAVVIARLGVRGEGQLYNGEPFFNLKSQVRSYEKLGVISSSLRRHINHVTAVNPESITNSINQAFESAENSLEVARQAIYTEILKSEDSDLFRRLQTIPGIGPHISAVLIAEIQDMVRFKKQKDIIAYVGLDPKIRQSGKVLNSTGRLTKRGSTHARRAIFIAAHVARQHDDSFRCYYDKKRNEGKTYKVATCAVARKLLLIVRAVWLSKSNYDPDFLRT